MISKSECNPSFQQLFVGIPIITDCTNCTDYLYYSLFGNVSKNGCSFNFLK